MADEVVFYTNPMSRGRMVRWMLEEIGIPYRTELVEYGAPMKGDDFCGVNPMGKVPALRHGDTVVTETAAICTYLADAFPAAGLAPPPGSKLRAPYYRWLFFGAGPVEAAVVNTTLGFVVPPERQGMAGYGSMELVLRVLTQALTGRDHLVGDTFTTADLYIGSHLQFGIEMFRSIPSNPVFEAYVARNNARPAAQRARGIDDALIAQKQAAAAA